MTERDWAGELGQWLRERFAELCEVIEQPVPLSGLRINPALGPEEAKYFLLGMEAGLFEPDELGYVRSQLLVPPGKGNGRPKTCQIFWYDPPPPRLFRECVCQLSTASFLIIRRGWLTSHVLINPECRDEESNSYGIDILVQSPEGRVLVCVEVKRTVAELQKLVTDLRTCCKRGVHAKHDCGFPQNHPKYEFCVAYQPVYFWAVSPEADVCLKMKYDQGAIEIEQLGSLPPRSLIESP
jgi:hypothetical protein